MKKKCHFHKKKILSSLMFEKFSESSTPVLQSRACVIGGRKGTEPDSLSPLLADALGETRDKCVPGSSERQHVLSSVLRIPES